MPTLLALDKVLASAGTSKPISIGSGSFTGGAAPGSIEAGLKFNVAWKNGKFLVLHHI